MCDSDFVHTFMTNFSVVTSHNRILKRRTSFNLNINVVYCFAMASVQSELTNCYNILTIHELKQIVCKTINDVDNVNVTKYEIEPDRNVFGYLGEYFRLTIYVESVSAFL